MQSHPRSTTVATSHAPDLSGERTGAPRRRSGRVDHAVHAARSARVALQRAEACR